MSEEKDFFYKSTMRIGNFTMVNVGFHFPKASGSAKDISGGNYVFDSIQFKGKESELASRFWKRIKKETKCFQDVESIYQEIVGEPSDLWGYFHSWCGWKPFTPIPKEATP